MEEVKEPSSYALLLLSILLPAAIAISIIQDPSKFAMLLSYDVLVPLFALIFILSFVLILMYSGKSWKEKLIATKECLDVRYRDMYDTNHFKSERLNYSQISKITIEFNPVLHYYARVQIAWNHWIKIYLVSGKCIFIRKPKIDVRDFADFLKSKGFIQNTKIKREKIKYGFFWKTKIPVEYRMIVLEKKQSKSGKK
jgi:hypothetical protein